MDGLKNGFYIQNATGVMAKSPSRIRVEAYDGNKQLIGDGADSIPYNNGMRFISADHVGSVDHIYVLVFYDTPNYNPPPGIGVISGPSGKGGGGGFSISIGGNGFGVSASGAVTVTQGFSQPAMVAKIELKEYYNQPSLAAFGDPARIAAMAITAIADDEGDDKLVPIYVEDFLTNKMAGPPGWQKSWSWGWTPPLVET